MDSADVSKLNVEGGGGHVTTLGGLVDQSAANANNINDIKNSLYGTNDQPGLTEQMKDLKDYADRIQGLANGAAAGVRENREDISELKSNNNLQDESIKFLEEKDTQQDASIDAINQKNDSQDASIDAINQKNDSQDASIDAIN